MEIERRFFIKNIEKVNELISEYKDSKKVIVQDYIFSDIFTAFILISLLRRALKIVPLVRFLNLFFR